MGLFSKIGLGLLVVLAAFLSFVASRDGHFSYERSDVIHAPAEKIFPYLSNFKLGGQWSPYEQMDPQMKKTYSGVDGQVGSAMEFESSKAGTGKVEILSIIPNQLVEIKLTMTKPMSAENIVKYKLTPESSGTRFTWSMSGDGGFTGKLFSVLLDCEKMIGGEFSKGIASLKSVVESQK